MLLFLVIGPVAGCGLLDESCEPLLVDEVGGLAIRPDTLSRVACTDHVAGDLYVFLPGDVELPSIQSIEGKLLLGDDVRSLRMPALRTVGAIHITQPRVRSLELPSLRRADAISVTSPAEELLMLDLSGLEHIEDYLWLEQVPSLDSFALPQLRSAGSIYLQDNPHLLLPRHTMPRLQSAHWLVVSGDPVRRNCSHPDARRWVETHGIQTVIIDQQRCEARPL